MNLTDKPADKPADKPTAKPTVATTWLDGCSGCHMSFLDLDQRLFELVKQIEIVYSPLVDAKDLPATVDLGIIEGSVSNDDDLHKAQRFRAHCRTLVSLGDCAVHGNVPAMRNTFPLDAVYDRAYRETATINPQRPTVGVPPLCERVQPVHSVVAVDYYIPGCPPAADSIWYVLTELLAGRTPDPSQVTRFGA